MYYTDASAKYGDWNLLPEKCMVPQARIMSESGGRWVNLSNVSNGSVLKTAKFTFNDSKYIGTITDTRKGNAAYDMKVSYYNHKNKEDFIESLAKRTNCKIDSFSVSAIDDTSAPIKMEYTQVADASLGDDFLYINPMMKNILPKILFKGRKGNTL
jgi:hypothetical protein